MKILNLYACLGGNRYKWGDAHEITSVELDPELARMYGERFPNDKIIVADAHEYLLNHYKEFDFIWSSPMCPTHGKPRFWKSKGGVYLPVYPDMSLYQEIIFLDNFFDGKYCVENVEPYYSELIPAQKRGRHLYWCNFILPATLTDRVEPIAGNNELKNLCEFHEIDVSGYKGEQRKDKIARNLVDFEAGKTILETALGIISQNNLQQTSLF